MAKKYDAIIIGGGHNGLVAAAYLAKAGRDVLVLETDRLDYIHDLIHRLDVMQRIEALLPRELGQPAV